MFDWNDEELTNIIWGEAGEGEDHIVPYPDGDQEKPPELYGDHVKKEKNQEPVDIKPTEQKKFIPQTDLHGAKLECSSQFDTNEGLNATEFSIDSWPDLSLPVPEKPEQDSMGAEPSNNVAKIPNQEGRSEDKTASLNTASEIFRSPLEESEQGDFVDYGWATVGSFEDLDRIFSNDEPIFGHASLGNADELWSSSKDVTSSPENSIPQSVDSSSLGIGALRNTSEQFEIKAEYLSDQSQSFTPGYKKLNLFTSNAAQENNSRVDNVQYAGGKSKLSMKEKTALEMAGSTPVFNVQVDAGPITTSNEYMEKGNRQKKLLKGRKKLEEKSEIRHLQDLQGSWTQTGNQFIQFNRQYGPAVGQPSSSLVSQQAQLQGPVASQYKNFPSPLTTLVHGNTAKQYSSLPVLSQFHHGGGSYLPVPSNYGVSPVDLSHLSKSQEAPMKSLKMTPQEKIEKLRRRQQMRAMFAIQKQQQQFGNQVSSTEYSVLEGENVEAEENPSTLPSLDPNSPIQQDDSNTVCTSLDDCSVPNSILFRLQEIIAKLDIRIRFCIRDSLFRLAQSATQRQFASDKSSSNKGSKDEVLRKEEANNHKRFPKTLDAETETNPIDRTIAHLLFHRPLELSGKVVETPESPLSSKLLPFERKATSSMSLHTNVLPQGSESKPILSQEESKVPCLFPEGDESKNTRLDALVNTSTSKSAFDGSTKVEASK